MIRYLRDFATTSLSSDNNFTTISGNLKVTANTNATSSDTGAIVTPGGIAAGKDLYVGGDLFVAGNTTTISTNNLSVQDSIIDLHAIEDGRPLVANDGRDIGIRINYYQAEPRTAFFGWSNDTGNFEYYSDATEGNNGKITGNLGGAKLNSLFLASNINATSTSTGAITVAGGAGFGGDVYAQGFFYANGVPIVGPTVSYTDLINKPNFANVATSGSYNDLLDQPTLANIALTGSYTDLKNKPTTIAEYGITDAVTISGTETLSNKTLTAPAINSSKVKGEQAITANLGTLNSGTTTVDLSSAQIFAATIASLASVTFAFSNAPSNGLSQMIMLQITNGGSGTVNWPPGTKFSNGASPTLTSSGIDLLGIFYNTFMSSYVVFVLGKDIK